MVTLMRLLMTLALAATLVSCSGSKVDMTAFGAALAERVSTVTADATTEIAEELKNLYEASGHAPYWLNDRARPTRDARAALALLHGAEAEGLDPDDYGAAVLETRADAFKDPEIEGLDQAAAFDVDLSMSVLRFLRHVHVGRVKPSDVGFRLTAPADDHGLAELVASAVAGGRVEQMVAEVRPAIPLYEPLREKLAEYRARAESDAVEALPAVSKAVGPGENYAGAGALARRLIATGDLPDEAAVPSDGASYDGPLVEAVARFQERHGLEPDGVLGERTLEALAVPLSWRARQIELALERLRWVPHVAEGRVIFVNIPMFHLWSWDRMSPTAAPVADMDIIVGRALDTETPAFVGDLSYLVFRPYWNVPPSITKEEILPALAGDAGYLHRQNMEIVRGQSDDGAEVVEATPENLALLYEGELRVRQRPGPANALGLVKFMFPNEHNVYLHSTPTPELFDRARRDFSHGCVRVADPVALADWVLNDRKWTPERITEAMERGAGSQVVTLDEPVQVILTYVTAMVWPDDGSMRFATDIYKHDQRLDRALANRQ
jgi:L,D-transpeptidase YcbB